MVSIASSRCCVSGFIAATRKASVSRSSAGCGVRAGASRPEKPLKLKRLEKFRPLLGTQDRVKVRRVSVDDRHVYGSAVLFNDEATQIEICCGKEKGWAATLTLESADALADASLRINLRFFGHWYRRQTKWKDAQAPAAIQELQTKLAGLQEKVEQLLSRESATSSATTTG